MKKEGLSLSKEDSIEVSSLLQPITKGRKSLSLNSLIKEWRLLSNRIQAGYQDTIYEYENEVGARTLIQKVIERVSEEGKHQIIKVIAEDDERFRSSTVQVNPPTYRNYKSSSWWLYRLPKKASDEFYKDALVSGYLL